MLQISFLRSQCHFCRERDPLEAAWVRGSLRGRLEDLLEDVPKKARSFEHHDHCFSLSVHSP